MFQRYHEVKSLQESEMVQTGGESRSSTPGNALDSRVMYISHTSPLTPQHTTLVNSYPSISSPVMTTVPPVFSSSKYLSSPPEAHRYSIDSYRTSNDSDEHIRYIVDSNRISVDPYSRHLSIEEHQRIPSEVQHRLRIEDQPLEPYHRSVDDLYRNSNPVDLQRVTDSNSQQLINAQRLVSQLQRIHSDGIRTATSSAEQLQRHDIDSGVSSPNATSLNYRSSINDSLRPSSELQRVVQESLLRTHADPQRLVQESFREYFAVSPRHSIDNENINPAPDLRLSENIRYSDSNRETLRYSSSPRITENMRISSNPHHIIQENIRPSSTSHDIISEDLRLDVEQNHLISDNLRLGSITSHSVMPENLRLGNIVTQNIMTENLRMDSDTSHSLLPENLRVRNNLHSILTNNIRNDTSHTLISDNQRMRIDSSHALISDNVRMRSEVSHHMTEDINGDVPLNMMHENLRMGTSAPHSIVSENRRVGIGPELSHSLLIENLRVGAHTPQEMIHDSMRRDTPHNLVHETLRMGDETSHNTMPENLRLGAETSQNMLRATLRMGTETSHNSIMHESMRIGSETPHMMHENLRMTPEASRMVPENLCLTDPTRQVIPENLHISPSVNGIGHISNGRMLTHGQPPNSPMSQMSSHYDSSPHRIMTDVPHTIKDQSPHYDDSPYRSEIQTINASVSTTPAPYLPSVPDPSSTPVSQYYSSSYTPHTSHSVHNNDYAAYIDDGCDEGNMSLEEKINRGYHDIKPFDQNYPVNVPLMHMSQDSLPPPPSIPKLPKPKKPKEPKPPRLPVVHKCTECSRVFKNSTQLKNHMWRHTGEKPFACDECGSKFTQQGNLRAHRRIHTGERPYQCPDCKACFTQLSTLKTHQKIHSDERPYKCNECDAAFRQVANLKTHLVTHTGERPHQCDMCEKAFTQKSNLKAHKNRVHTGEGITIPAKRGRKKNPLAIKPFNCLECGAKFTMVSNLKIHAKLHSGDKPFECDYCGAGFAQRSNLKTHIQRMHGGGPASKRRRIRCDECPAMFRLKRCLKTHKKRRHPIKSLKIKILRESKYMMNSVQVEDEEDSEEEEEEEGDGEEEDEFDYDEDDESEVETKISPLLNKKSKTSMAKNNAQATCHGEESGTDDLGSSDDKMETSITEPIICLREPKSEPFESPVSPPLSDDCRITEDYSTERVSPLQTQPLGKENEPLIADRSLPILVENQRYEGSLNIKEEGQQSHRNEAESNHMPLLSSKAIAS